MARPTISQRIALEGGDQIRKALSDLGKAGEDAFAQLQKAGEKVNLSAPITAIEGATKRTGAVVDELRQRLTGAGGAAAQSGTGFLQLGGAVQSTQERLVAAVNVGARVGLAIQGIGTAFSGAFGKAREFGEGVTGAIEKVGATVLKSVATLTAVPAAFLAIAVSAADAAAKIKEASIAAGTSPQEYQKLTIAAEQMGGSEEKLVLALSLINEKVQEQSQNFFANQQRLQDLREAMAKGGLAGRQAAEDFKRLQREMDLFGPGAIRSGQAIIDVDKALKNLGGSNRDAIERLKGLADEINALPTPAEKAARVVEIFGRRLGPQLVELLSGGRTAIEDIGKRAEDLGLVLTDTQLHLAKEMNDSLALLRRSVAGTKNSIGLLFAPAIIEAAELFTEAIGKNRTQLILWASEIAAKVRPVLLDIVRALTGDADKIETGWVKTARQLIIDLGAAIANVTQNIIIPALSAFAALLQTVAESINGIFGTKLTAADIGVILLLAKMVGAFTLLSSVLRLTGGAIGLVRGAFAALAGAGNVLLVALEALGGVFAIVRTAVVSIVAAFGAVTVAIAAIGFAIGFLAVTLARSVDWSAFAARARAALDAVIGFITSLAGSFVGLFQALAEAAGAIWGSLSSAALAAFGAIVAGAAELWVGLSGLWQSGVAALGGFWEQIASAAQAAWAAIVAGASALWTSITTTWQAGVDAIGALWETLKSAAQTAWQAVLDGVTNAWAGIAALWSAGVDRVIGFLARLRDFALSVWKAIADAARQAFGAQQDAASAGAGFASGGPVLGAGSATSDSIPAWLSNGEFVIRAAAVRKYGLSLFDALNRMRLDPDAVARFAQGGLVRSLQVLMPQPMRFAEGGLVAGGTETLRPINLTIGAEHFAGLLAPDDVAQKLIRVAVSKQIRSAGRKPRYYGSGR
jgi:hypothetical protein